jgi:hypothetical protein
LIVLLILPTTPALAHGEDWWSDDWPAGDVKYDMSVEVPSVLGSPKHDYFAAGGHAWNDLTDTITFKRSGSEVADFQFDLASNCSQHDSALHFEPIGVGEGATVICFDFWQTRIASFQLALNSSKSWYWALTPPIQPSEWDVKGVATHEFGHAAGGWVAQSENGHFNAGDDPGECAASVPVLDLHTMCNGEPLKRLKGTFLEQHLEFHDIHTFEARYP